MKILLDENYNYKASESNKLPYNTNDNNRQIVIEFANALTDVQPLLSFTLPNGHHIGNIVNYESIDSKKYTFIIPKEALMQEGKLQASIALFNSKTGKHNTICLFSIPVYKSSYVEDNIYIIGDTPEIVLTNFSAQINALLDKTNNLDKRIDGIDTKFIDINWSGEDSNIQIDVDYDPQVSILLHSLSVEELYNYVLRVHIYNEEGNENVIYARCSHVYTGGDKNINFIGIRGSDVIVFHWDGQDGMLAYVIKEADYYEIKEAIEEVYQNVGQINY